MAIKIDLQVTLEKEMGEDMPNERVISAFLDQLFVLGFEVDLTEGGEISHYRVEDYTEPTVIEE